MNDVYLEPDDQQEAELSDALSTTGMTEEDRQEILAEIDQLVSDNKIPITKELFRIKPKKRGILMPLLINLFAVAIVAGMFFLAQYRFNRQQIQISESQSYGSVEGDIISQMKKQAEEELNRKNAEITKIQDDLKKLDEESRNLQENFDEIVDAEKNKMEQQYARELEAERERLRLAGTSTDDIEKQLAGLKADQDAKLNSEIVKFKTEQQAEIAKKVAELKYNNELLLAAEKAKTDIVNDSNKRIAEQEAAFEAEKEALEEQATEAESEITRLKSLRQQETNLNEQIVSSYSGIIKNIQNSEFQKALAGIDTLEKLYLDPKIATLPSVVQRKDNDLFILDSLREQIELKTKIEEIDSASMATAATVLVSTTEYAQQGIDAYSEGKTEEARTTLKQAVEKVPEIYEAFTTLQKIDAASKTDISKNHLKTGAEYFSQNALTKAVESYQEAALVVSENNKAEVSEALKGMSQVYEKLNEEEISKLNAEIRRLKDTGINQVKEINKLQASYDTLNADYTALLEQKEVVVSDSEATGDQLTALQSTISGLQTDLSASRAKQNELQAGIDSLSADLVSTREELNTKTTEFADADAALSAKDAENLELNTALTAAQENLAQIQEQISALEENNRKLENELEAVKTSFTGNQEDYDAAVSSLSEYQNRIDQLEADKEKLNNTISLDQSTIAALNAEIDDYRDQVNTLQTSINSSESDSDDIQLQITQQQNEISSLENQLSSEQNRYAQLESYSRGLESDIEDYRGIVDNKDSAISKLEQEKSVLETDLKNAIDDSEKNLRQLKADSEKSIEAKDDFIDTIINAYVGYQDSISEKLAEDSASSVSQAKNLLNTFLNRQEINALFPDFTSLITSLQTASLNIERAGIEARARDEALNDVLIAARYFSGKTTTNASYYTDAIEKLSKDDSKYREIVDSFQTIAEQSESLAAAAAAITHEELTLAGSIVSVGSSQIIIEPLSRSTGEIAVGDVVYIKRKDRYGRETDVTQARITSVQSGRITASYVDSSDPNKKPLTADLVYYSAGE